MILRVGNIKVTCYSISFRFTMKILMPLLVERPNYAAGYYNVWKTRVIQWYSTVLNLMTKYMTCGLIPVRREWFPQEGVFPGLIIALVTARK